MVRNEDMLSALESFETTTTSGSSYCRVPRQHEHKFSVDFAAYSDYYEAARICAVCLWEFLQEQLITTQVDDSNSAD